MLLPGSGQDKGLFHLRCGQPVGESMDRLEAALKQRGVRIFARIDHAAAAAEAGLKMRPAQVLLFGNPAVGTPMMVAAPTLAIDLPSKVLVWEDENGAVWLTYNDPAYLKNRHGIPEPLAGHLNNLVSMLDEMIK